MRPNDADGMANNVDPDHTAPLIWVCTVCPDLSIRIITVSYIHITCILVLLPVFKNEAIFNN